MKITYAIHAASPVISLIISLMLQGCSNQTADNPQAKSMSTIRSASTAPANRLDTLPIQKADLEKIYAQAISDYLKLVQNEKQLAFDTLYFGKHVYGQPDDFPEITLPTVIENTNIQLISPSVGTKLQAENKSSYYINLIGWVDADNADFNFVTFSNGMKHQFDCFIKYKYENQNHGFNLESSRFENFSNSAK